MRDSGRHIRRSLLNRSIVRLVVLTLVWATWSSCAHLAAESSGKTHRKVVVMVEPEYPAVLKNGHFEGQVRLEATVQPNGSVSHVEVKGGNPMLSQYASQAVMKWKYAPGSAQTIEEVVFNFNASVR